MSHRLVFLFASLLALGLPRADAADPTRWKLSLEPTTAAPGELVEVIASFENDAGWHIYPADHPGPERPTVLSVETTLTPEGQLTTPASKEKKDVFTGKPVKVVPGKGAFRQKYRIPNDAALGEIALEARISWMSCDASSCLPPADSSKTLLLTVKAPEKTAEPKNTEPKTTPPESGNSEAAGLPGGGIDLGLGAGGLDLGLGAAPGASDAAEQVVEWSLALEPAEAKAGESVKLVASYKNRAGWHIYPTAHPGPEVATSLAVSSPLVAEGPLTGPAGKEKKDPFSGKLVKFIEGEGSFRQTLRVPAGTPPGNVELAATLSWMSCDASSCLPPETLTEKLALTVLPGGAAAGTPTQADRSPIGEKGAEARSERGPKEAETGTESRVQSAEQLESLSLWAFILAFVGGGLIALLMPCTYPMIPITISFFTKQAEARKGSVLPLALAYGFGIIVSFVAIGLLVSLGLTSSKAVLSFAANPWLNLGFGALFIVFALSLFGLYEIRLPSSLGQVGAKAMGGGGYPGVFMLGLILVITSFTCTAPIMGSLLVFAAKAGSAGKVIMGMAAFGATMALPFVFLGLFPAKVQALPRSGQWMNNLKVFLGFVEIAAALKFISNAEVVWDWESFPREFLLGSWAIIFLLAGLFLLGLLSFKSKGQPGVGVGRRVAGLLTVLAGLYFGRGAVGYRLDGTTESLAPPYSLWWKQVVAETLEEGEKLAKENELPMLIDFTGPT